MYPLRLIYVLKRNKVRIWTNNEGTRKNSFLILPLQWMEAKANEIKIIVTLDRENDRRWSSRAKEMCRR